MLRGLPAFRQSGYLVREIEHLIQIDLAALLLPS
jgi:hypothetical protein